MSNLYESLPEPLTTEEERQLLCADRADNSVRDQLLLHTLKDAIKYAGSCCRGLIPNDELMSLCSVALINAIKNYDPEHEKQLRLMQFAKPYIRGQLQKTWRERNPVSYGADIPDKVGDENIESIPEEEHEDPDFDGIHVRERWEWVKPHFSKLSETEARVLILLYESRFNMADIGRMLDCTRENVRITKNRALKKIRNGLYRERKLLGDT